MWLLVAADPSAPAGVSDQLIIVVGGVITAAIVALGGVLVAVVNSRSNRTSASPPAPMPSANDHVLYERTAVNSKRLDDSDERFHMLDLAQDKTRDDLDDVIEYLARNDPDWRP